MPVFDSAARPYQHKIMCHSLELNSLSLAKMSSSLFCCFRVNYQVLVTTQGLTMAPPHRQLSLLDSTSAFQALLPEQVWQSWVPAFATEAPAYSVGRSPPAALQSCFLAEADSIWQQEKHNKKMPCWHAIQATGSTYCSSFHLMLYEVYDRQHCNL